MLPALIDINLFRDAIERDCLILTPNQRLAAKIIQAWVIANLLAPGLDDFCRQSLVWGED